MRSVLRIAVAGTAALSLAACGGTGGDAGSQNLVNGKTFTMVLPGDPGNLDPHFTSLSVTMQVDRFLYDSLVAFDKDGTSVPNLAEKWEATTTTAKFTLRKGITCSDGSPLTAATVAANINFVGDPKNSSSRIGVYVPPGATATADDAAGTVTVTSPVPNSFLDRAVGALHIVCDKGMKDRDLLKQGASGTGMFTVTEVVPADHYTLERRKDYAWGPGDWKADQQGLPDKVTLRIVANESTAVNLLVSGEANAAGVIGPDQQRLQAQKAVQRDVMAMFGELWFNQKPGLPGADAAVRRGLTQALDLGQLTQVLTSGTGQLAKGLVAPGMTPCDPDTISGRLPAHDLAAAKTTLDTAGWRAGSDGIRVKDGKRLAITLFYTTELGTTMQATAELMQKFWQEAGVEVSMKGGTHAELSQVIVAGQGSWDAGIVPLNVSSPGAIVPFVSGPTPPNGTNFAGIQNSKYAALVQEASVIAGTAGCGKWAEAERALAENVDVVPFANANRPIFGKGATFELTEGSLAPGTIRMLGA
ncbi:ABC transporter substrate-binding protein [Kibdelosporangium persicum]|uniref:Periplasmic substrate-binding component of ABC-type dipeptide/oligopeptide transport system n=1 Tax=Kibdelosporangium persicum TaxID=2698649 RepID=A0ABX2F8I0_9PSEU|nr:ABC transporter substrate-binding protein [Kibdelosporangium persicum]NRN67280.1 Periplasmic substrate-binding component of ABC-type dipeptide/oligopeptide transport system [Kibdelosporangium persicum]